MSYARISFDARVQETKRSQPEKSPKTASRYKSILRNIRSKKRRLSVARSRSKATMPVRADIMKGPTHHGPAAVRIRDMMVRESNSIKHEESR